MVTSSGKPKPVKAKTTAPAVAETETKSTKSTKTSKTAKKEEAKEE